MALYDRVWFATATTGTGAITVGAAVSGYRTPSDASIPNAGTFPYVIIDGSAWEIGTGTYTSAGTTVARSLIASSTGALLNLSGAATMFIDSIASKLPQLDLAQTWAAAQAFSALFGYGPAGAGVGGSVTQLTSKSTAVTLNKLCGDIVMHNASLGAGTSVNFLLNNSFITADSFVGLMQKNGTNGAYLFGAGGTAAGVASIHIRNMSGSAIAEAVAFRFIVLNAPNS